MCSMDMERKSHSGFSLRSVLHVAARYSLLVIIISTLTGANLAA